jgi:chromosome partitioning protein
MDLVATHVSDYKALAELVEAQQHAFDYIVLDGPPRMAEMVAVTIALSDLALIPVGASAAETWATADMLDSIERAQEKSPDLLVRTVWTRYRGYTRSAQEISKAADKDFGLKPLRTKIGFRVAYPDALEQGLTVTEGRWPEAASEIQSLVREIRRLLK